LIDIPGPHDQAAKDVAERAAILAALERQLRSGGKALVGKALRQSRHSVCKLTQQN
jgi:hypothetical protein